MSPEFKPLVPQKKNPKNPKEYPGTEMMGRAELADNKG
jgi:hypothetical protein